MNAPTPEQMRALVEVLEGVELALPSKTGVHIIVARDFLRTAADQLDASVLSETVRREVKAWWLENETDADALIARILTADTAPQEHHPACGALDEPCHCAERGDAPQEDRDERLAARHGATSTRDDTLSGRRRVPAILAATPPTQWRQAMTEPVNTDALRKAGERADYYQTGEGPLWRAAADELDRVRSELAKSNINAGLRIEELRAVIKNAPHDRDESCGFGVDPRDMSHCTCWKADAL